MYQSQAIGDNFCTSSDKLGAFPNQLKTVKYQKPKVYNKYKKCIKEKLTVYNVLNNKQ